MSSFNFLRALVLLGLVALIAPGLQAGPKVSFDDEATPLQKAGAYRKAAHAVRNRHHFDEYPVPVETHEQHEKVGDNEC